VTGHVPGTPYRYKHGWIPLDGTAGATPDMSTMARVSASALMDKIAPKRPSAPDPADTTMVWLNGERKSLKQSMRKVGSAYQWHDADNVGGDGSAEFKRSVKQQHLAQIKAAAWDGQIDGTSPVAITSGVTAAVGLVYSPRTPGIASQSEDHLCPAPDIGQDSVEVLLQAGFDRAAIDDLIKAGAVRAAEGGGT